MPQARPPRHPSSQSTSKLEKRIEAAVEFATNLKQILTTASTTSELSKNHTFDAALTESLISDITKHVDRLHACQQTYVPGLSGDPEIDGLATGLWNTCTRLGREYKVGLGDEIDGGGNDGEGRGKRVKMLTDGKGSANGGGGDGRKRGGKIGRLGRLYLYGKVLAFHLLSVARPKENGRFGVVVRLMRLGLKVVRDCVDSGEVKLASPVMQLAADYKVWLQNMVEGLPDEEVKECRCLEMEYFIMRTALCWLENRLDVAEHMYTKAETLLEHLTPEYAERLANVLYEIGKSLSAGNDFKTAIKWFKRATDVINGQDIEQLSREGLELRLAILQALVTALLGAGTAEGLEEAKNYVGFIEAESGNKFVVLLLKLELLQKMPAEAFDSEAYADILRHIIRTFSFSESGFKLIMHHIRKLHDKSPGAGCAVLDDFIVALSGAERDGGWIEKSVVTRIWMITNQRDSTETINAAQDVLRRLSRPLSAEAAVAAQALLWKKLESNYSQGQYDLAESWCHLSLHSVFSNCGAGNTSKLERKLLMCALARNSLDAATTIIHKMSPQSWKEPMTTYLAFKVAIRVEDRAMAEKCLETVTQAPDHVDYLGACIAESQKAGDIMCAIAALRKLQESYEYKEPNPIHLPALFRCTIRLLNLMAEKPGGATVGVVKDLCDEFDAVVLALERQKDDPSSRKLFTIDELEWFSRNAYNLALKNTTTWELRSVVRMLTACVKIIGHFPSDISSQVDSSLKSLFCHFVISSALVALARTQDNVEKQRQDYATMRKHVMAFDGELPERLPQLDHQSKDDMLRKHAALLAFDFEAAAALQQWDDLSGVVQRAVPCKNVTAFQAMADCLLRAQAPGQVLYSTMRKIVNEIWVLESFDAVKLAKYTRCLFQATLTLDDGLAMRLLDEACSKARELRESQAAWPEEELEWMATTSFNHAIDCYSAHEVERAKDWATKAINLAHYCSDGRLEEILQGKYLRLSLDGGGS